MSNRKEDLPLISVLMSTYNESKDYIEASVNSILNQTYKNIEFVIIVDNPNNAALIEFLEYIEKCDKRVKIVYNNENIGLVESLNKGLKFCTGDYVARMDADDVAAYERLQVQLNYLQDNNLDLVASNFKLFSDDKKYNKIFRFPSEHDKCVKKLKYANCLQHPTWLGKKDVFYTLKGYRNIDTCEDYDFIIRAVLAGFKIANCPEVLLNYRYNINSISRKNAIRQKLIADYLAVNFRHNNICTIEDYNMYVKSEKFDVFVKKEEKIQLIKNKYKNTKNSLSKCLCLVELFCDMYFWYKGIMNTIRRIKQKF